MEWPMPIDLSSRGGAQNILCVINDLLGCLRPPSLVKINADSLGYCRWRRQPVLAGWLDAEWFLLTGPTRFKNTSGEGKRERKSLHRLRLAYRDRLAALFRLSSSLFVRIPSIPSAPPLQSNYIFKKKTLPQDLFPSKIINFAVDYELLSA